MADEESTNTSTSKTRTIAASTTDLAEIKIQQLFKLMVDQGASDLHITCGSPPAIRLHGEIVRIKLPPLNKKECRKLVYQVLNEKQKLELEKNYELDFSFGVKGLARFRGNVFYAQGALSAAFRVIPSIIPDFEALNLPTILMEMTSVANGLILVTGPTGSGKSTTLASMIDKLNQTESGHIITLEDPIEFVHQHKSCIINQREIGMDSLSFANGLKSLLRQDPDIILVGELRDQETIEAALTIAETGHLVFGTLHTNSTVQTINRIINVFPADKQDQIRSLLSFVLQGVVAQQLVPKKDSGRQLIQEVLFPTLAIRNLIREDKIHQIYSQMQVGQEKTGMSTMNQGLMQAFEKGLITRQTALDFSNNPEEMIKMLGMDSSES
ncbi:MAG: type IV pilus twitching motility protein PilT [Halobacteriovoraceae bacterium]|nr:type IV pilus twitching motility protein PilT [Halobacteriovoraceae bacterium]